MSMTTGTATAFRVNIIVRPKTALAYQTFGSLMNTYHGGPLRQILLDRLMLKRRLTIPASQFQLASGIQTVTLKLDP